LGRLADDAETAETNYRAALATTAAPLLAFFPSEDDARAFATIGLATLLRASFRPREAARMVKGLSQIGGRAVEAVWQHAQACALMSMDWTRGPASPAHEHWIEEGLALLDAIAAPEMHVRNQRLSFFRVAATACPWGRGPRPRRRGDVERNASPEIRPQHAIAARRSETRVTRRPSTGRACSTSSTRRGRPSARRPRARHY
jgi:hypothetical protein